MRHIIAFLAALLYFIGVAHADEFPRPSGTLQSIGGVKHVCYDRDNTEIIALYTEVLLPSQLKRINMLERDVDALERQNQALRDQLDNNEIVQSIDDNEREQMKLALMNEVALNLELTRKFKIKRSVHWAVHGIGVAALSVFVGLYAIERNN